MFIAFIFFRDLKDKLQSPTDPQKAEGVASTPGFIMPSQPIIETANEFESERKKISKKKTHVVTFYIFQYWQL